MKKIIRFLLAIIICLFGSYKVNAASDIEAPEIVSVSIDKHDVTVGDIITITLEATDETGIKGSRSASFKGEGDNNSIYFYLKPQDDGTYKGTITITESTRNGEYKLYYINLEDTLGNQKSYTAFPGKEEMYFTVTGAASDIEAPEIVSVSIDKHDVTVGDIITITLEATDETGIKGSRSASFKGEGDNNSIYFYLKPQDDGTYKGTITITESTRNGEYKLYYINLEDTLGNQKSYTAFPGKEEMYFTVTGAASDIEAPEIVSVSIDKHDVTVGDIITITLEATDETGIKGSRSASFKGEGDNNSIYFYLKPQDDGTYKGTITITESTRNGEYKLYYINLEDTLGNQKSYTAFPGKEEMYFTVYDDPEYVSIAPLEGVNVFSKTSTINNEIIYGDVYIGEEAIVTLQNCTIYGNIYVLGALRASSISMNSDYGIYARQFIWGYVSNYSNGMVSISGSNSISKMNASDYPVTYIPYRIDVAESKNGILIIKGAIADVTSFYINDTPVTLNNNKLCSSNISVSEASSITLKWVTPFGNTISSVVPIDSYAFIYSHPESIKARIGENIVFRVKAVGPGLTYQWQYKTPTSSTWKDFSSGNNATLRKKLQDSWDGWKIRCVVTDDENNTVISEEATITVKRGADITKQPENAEGLPGEYIEFRVEAEGPGLTYQWQYKTPTSSTWKDFSSGNNATLRKKLQESWDNWKVRCVISADDGYSTTSEEASIRIVRGPQITRQPESVREREGKIFNIAVEAAGDNLSYQWQYKTATSSTWKNFSNGNNATLSKRMQGSWDGWRVRCVVSNERGASSISEEAELILKVGTEIIRQPESVSGKAGEYGNFTVEAEGDGTLSYQWQYKVPNKEEWKNFSNGTNATLRKRLQESWDGWRVRCVITDASGNSVTSEEAYIDIEYEGIEIIRQPESVETEADKYHTFVIEATGEGLSYQWQYKVPNKEEWKNFSNGTGATMRKKVLGSWDGWKIRCIITDASGNSVTSDEVSVTVEG